MKSSATVEDQERINGVAIEYRNKVSGLVMAVFSLPSPNRHNHIFSRYNHMIPQLRVGCIEEQGFVTSSGRFLNRVDALKVAKKAGQVRRKSPPHNELFSEDLW